MALQLTAASLLLLASSASAFHISGNVLSPSGGSAGASRAERGVRRSASSCSSSRNSLNRAVFSWSRGGGVLPTLLRAAELETETTTEVDTAKDTAADAPKAKKPPRGHGGMGKADRNSFVQTEMRRAAMKLHTRDQAPKEGEKKNEGKKFSEWSPTREGYLQFLVDSKVVYSALEEGVKSSPKLEQFRSTGLERVQVLEKDIKWMEETYSLTAPGPSDKGQGYADFIDETVQKSIPAFMCHYYNHYFAHTAGGQMIGRKVSEACLDGTTLDFYKWDGDVKELLDGVRKQIDAQAKEWSREEKDECLEETGRTFMYGGALLGSITG